MIKVNCIKCGNELDDMGAVILSPPWSDRRVTKSHLCTTCWDRLRTWLLINDWSVFFDDLITLNQDTGEIHNQDGEHIATLYAPRLPSSGETVKFVGPVRVTIT